MRSGNFLAVGRNTLNQNDYIGNKSFCYHCVITVSTLQWNKR